MSFPCTLSWEGSPCSPLRGYSPLRPRDSAIVRAGPQPRPASCPLLSNCSAFREQGNPLRAPGLLADGLGHHHCAQTQCHPLGGPRRCGARGFQQRQLSLPVPRPHPSQAAESGDLLIVHQAQDGPPLTPADQGWAGEQAGQTSQPSLPQCPLRWVFWPVESPSSCVRVPGA